MTTDSQSHTEALAEVLKAVLQRDSEFGPSGMPNACNCINLSRRAEREYEIGECPHQRARDVLVAYAYDVRIKP